jgi:PIN domain nuclease of toxin-antitoxin system
MKYLLDTHLLIWAAQGNERLSVPANALIADEANEIIFSAVSIWEITIKASLERPNFRLQPAVFHRTLLDHGYRELAISSRHCLAVSALAPIHKDPFDRLLLAQAVVEGITLLTSDQLVANYPAVPVRLV